MGASVQATTSIILVLVELDLCDKGNQTADNLNENMISYDLREWMKAYKQVNI